MGAIEDLTTPAPTPIELIPPVASGEPEPEQDHERGLVRALRSSLVLGGSSVATVLVALVTSKVWALLVGPAGVGYLGLVQNLVQLLTLVAGIGMGTAVVRLGASVSSARDHRGVREITRAAWLISGCSGLLWAAAVVLFRGPVSIAMLGGRAHEGAVFVVAVTLLFSMGSNLEIGLLNMHREVGALARAAIGASVVGAIASITLVALWGVRAVPWVVLTTMLSVWGVTWLVRRRVVHTEPVEGPLQLRGASRALLRFGSVYTTSLLVSTGVQLTLPVMILHLLGTESVGFHRAAMAISTGYLAVLLTAMDRDYYPQLSAVSSNRTAMQRLVTAQQELVLLIGGPIILGCLALMPFLVPLVYSASFTPATRILEWQLVGELFKFTSFTLSFVILASAPSGAYLQSESVAGVTLLAFSWIGLHFLGLSGLGIAYCLSYVCYFVVVTLIVRHRVGIVWERRNITMFAAFVAAAVIVATLPHTPLAPARTPIAILIAGVASVLSFRRLWSLFGSTVTARLRRLGFLH